MRQRTLVYFEQELYQLGSLRSFSHLSLTSCTSGIYLNRSAAWLSGGGTTGLQPVKKPLSVTPERQLSSLPLCAPTPPAHPQNWQRHRLDPKKKEGSKSSPSSLQLRLLSVLQRVRSVGRLCGRVHANHQRLVAEKVPETGDVRGNRVGVHVERGADRAVGRGPRSDHHKRVAALGARRQSRVDDVCSGRANRAGIQLADAVRILLAGAVIRNLRGVQRADGSHGRGLVRRDAGLQQVRDRDSCDNQNNRHNNKQLEKRETLLLLLHEISLRECLVPEHA